MQRFSSSDATNLSFRSTSPSPADGTMGPKERMNNLSKGHLHHLSRIFPITEELKLLVRPEELPRSVWPVYRVMDENGVFRNLTTAANQDTNSLVQRELNYERGDLRDELDSLRKTVSSQFPYLRDLLSDSTLFHSSTQPFIDMPSHQSTNTLLRAHRLMVRLRQMDNILQNAQRQGRISFYMTCFGEEAIHIGSASALESQDVVLAQYREAGVLMWRGFSLEQFANQCFSNDLDLGHGRQMPIHYGSKALNYHTISSPLGTQLPQAVGVAYKMKLDMLTNQSKNKSIAIAYFGDGCASTPDFHSACNFAATLKTPVIFFCRNNGYAISTPVTEQYAGDGIVARAPGYGMAAIRVDGNDLFAVHFATKCARIYALEHMAPVMIEAITYRLGHHSTSDDSTRYRSPQEIELAKESDPLTRVTNFLESHGLITEADLSKMIDEERIDMIKAMEKAEQRPPPNIDKMFSDVYYEMPAHLQIQERSLHEHRRVNDRK